MKSDFNDLIFNSVHGLEWKEWGLKSLEDKCKKLSVLTFFIIISIFIYYLQSFLWFLATLKLTLVSLFVVSSRLVCSFNKNHCRHELALHSVVTKLVMLLQKWEVSPEVQFPHLYSNSSKSKLLCKLECCFLQSLSLWKQSEMCTCKQ